MIIAPDADSTDEAVKLIGTKTISAFSADWQFEFLNVVVRLGGVFSS